MGGESGRHKKPAKIDFSCLTPACLHGRLDEADLSVSRKDVICVTRLEKTKMGA